MREGCDVCGTEWQENTKCSEFMWNRKRWRGKKSKEKEGEVKKVRRDLREKVGNKEKYIFFFFIH